MGFPCFYNVFPHPVYHVMIPMFHLCFSCVSNVFLVMTPVCSEETSSITHSSKDDQSVVGQYDLVTEAIIRISAINGLLQLRAVACVNHLRPHARGLPLECA